ncbi:MAG: hypothetical protein K2V38_23680 [Gemmataceae bacterium]|nr:hypothetical protein [Gemmataceae bacterium]
MDRKKKPDADPAPAPHEPADTPADTGRSTDVRPTAPVPDAGPTEPVSEELAPGGPPEGGHASAHRPTGPVLPNPFGYRRDNLAGVRLLEDRRLRQVQLAFAEKPSDEVRQVVREAGFRWLQKEQVWAQRVDPQAGWQTRADAEKLFERVVDLIRAEKGIARAHD